MIGYILDPLDRSAVQQVSISSYDLPIASEQGENGSIEINGSFDADYTGFLLQTDETGNLVFKIGSFESGNEETTKCSITDELSIFDGYKPYVTARRGLSGGALLADILCGSYATLRDESGTGAFPTYHLSKYTTGYYKSTYDRMFYRYAAGEYDENIPTWLASKFNSLGTTLENIGAKFVKNVDSSTAAYTLDSYAALQYLNANGIKIYMSIAPRRYAPSPGNITYKNVLIVSFKDISGQPTAVIPFSDGHSHLVSESYSSDIVSHILVVSTAGSGNGRCDYFMRYDGSMAVVLNPAGSVNPENQMIGNNIVLETSLVINESTAHEGGAVYDLAVAEFAKNSSESKVEFYSDKELSLFQPVKLMLKRGILETKISSIKKKSGDNRYLYTCGQLSTTTSEKIKENSWSYEKRLPDRPYVGQLVMM